MDRNIHIVIPKNTVRYENQFTFRFNLLVPRMTQVDIYFSINGRGETWASEFYIPFSIYGHTGIGA